MEETDSLVHRELQVLKALQEAQETPVLLDPLDQSDNRATTVCRDPLELRACRETLEYKESEDHKDLAVLMEALVQLEIREHRDSQEILELKETKDHRVPKEEQVPRDNKDLKVL